MTNPQIAEIAARLTAAQKRALLWLAEAPNDKPRAWAKGTEAPLYALAEGKGKGNPAIAPVLIWQLCVAVGRAPPCKANIWGKTLWRATPLGQSVAAYLKEQSNG
jgi:hypothetical protein